MVRGVNTDGTLRLRPLGGINFSNVEGENVTLHTRGGKTYTGTLVCAHHSTHAFDDARTMERNEKTVFVLLDEEVSSVKDVRALGICNGDFVSIDPRLTITEKGYVKSRFIDNKAAMAMSFSVLKALKDEGEKPACNTVFAFLYYEEIGWGGAFVPHGISEHVSIDIAVLGPDADGSDHGVTICAKDATTPYDYLLTGRLIDMAERAGLTYAVDLFYRYGSDSSEAFKSANDVRIATFGMGVHSSHGVERAHLSGIENTVRLLAAYVMGE
jgi:putative aminopeptidase FrvX